MQHIQKELRELITIPPEKAAVFFKTSVGEYAETEAFLGIKVPDLRALAKKHKTLSLKDLKYFLGSRFNEERLFAVIILVEKYRKADQESQEELFQFYLDNLKNINNWNLVDASAHLIMGAHLENRDKELLFTLATSENLWERRIAIVSTWHMIKVDKLATTFALAESLLNEPHDLVQKAAGWMLREAGKKNEEALVNFLEKHGSSMPRTMLRYSIEKFSKDKRAYFLTRK